MYYGVVYKSHHPKMLTNANDVAPVIKQRPKIVSHFLHRRRDDKIKLRKTPECEDCRVVNMWCKNKKVSLKKKLIEKKKIIHHR